jgi:NAD(P)-dependent dehydrogenase (short-subunit alcohol dehydrogenase family)
MGFQLDFTGKRVLITGSTKGIGRGAAEGFHELGAHVAINGRLAETVAQAIEEMGGGERLIAAPGDLSSVAGVKTTVSAAIADLGGLDVLVNNAGRGDDRPIDGLDEEYWQIMIDLNLKGAFFTAQACVPALKESKGNIINIASMMGVMGGPEGLLVYSATKGAMIQMSRMMALELARDGVRVNNLCPGWIETPMIQNENELAGDDALLNYIKADCPLGRIGHVDETTGAILYFASQNAGYTTGSTLVTDGGISEGR